MPLNQGLTVCWSVEATSNRWFACRERTFTFRFRSAEAYVDYFRTYYGPTVKAFETAGTAGGAALFGDLVDLVRRFARTTSGPVSIPATYLETVAVRTGGRA